MKRNHLLILAVIAALMMMFSQAAVAKTRITFGGGPAGGTFQTVGMAVSVFDPIKNAGDYMVKVQASNGDVVNIRNIDSNRVQMATCYAGSAWKARNGKLPQDDKKYENVVAVAWLYGAPAQLVVKKGSGIKSVKDLVGKKVGVGPAGSGAFANCEIFFTHMGVWDKIERNAVGYNDAANYFGNNQLDAFWLFTAFPSGAVSMAATTNDIALIDLDADAQASGFYDAFPYFGKLTIPANTYEGVDYDSPSFQDSAIWAAHKDVPAEIIYDMLAKIYTPEGLAHMKAQKSTFKYMSVESGPSGIPIPFHPGAEKFWKEKGVLK
jgi:hypothetical protein